LQKSPSERAARPVVTSSNMERSSTSIWSSRQSAIHPLIAERSKGKELAAVGIALNDHDSLASNASTSYACSVFYSRKTAATASIEDRCRLTSLAVLLNGLAILSQVL
jgi:hypothetical protein